MGLCPGTRHVCVPGITHPCMNGPPLPSVRAKPPSPTFTSDLSLRFPFPAHQLGFPHRACEDDVRRVPFSGAGGQVHVDGLAALGERPDLHPVSQPVHQQPAVPLPTIGAAVGRPAPARRSGRRPLASTPRMTRPSSPPAPPAPEPPRPTRPGRHHRFGERIDRGRPGRFGGGHGPGCFARGQRALPLPGLGGPEAYAVPGNVRRPGRAPFAAASRGRRRGQAGPLGWPEAARVPERGTPSASGPRTALSAPRCRSVRPRGRTEGARPAGGRAGRVRAQRMASPRLTGRPHPAGSTSVRFRGRSSVAHAAARRTSARCVWSTSGSRVDGGGRDDLDSTFWCPRRRNLSPEAARRTRRCGPGGRGPWHTPWLPQR
ncbi:hypothetical protein SAVIM40S_02353 [Streptomyces avidinii]|uniref:Basic proline-rich protein-like n=1 Tax=Streptomyces avidinii TaxID=1895 RepID=A0ABS4KZ77_STRAV|nr:hypothetical protein [Streptomyces avidinii]